MTKQTAHIEDWQEYGGCLIGRVSLHPNQESFLKDVQMTSALVSIDEERGVAETRNTMYTLGKKVDIVN